MRSSGRKIVSSAQTISYVADMLAELQRLAGGYRFLAYLIEMAQKEAEEKARKAEISEAVIASSVSAQSRPAQNGQ